MVYVSALGIYWNEYGDSIQNSNQDTFHIYLWKFI